MKKLDCAQFVLKAGLDAALQIFGEQVWDKAKLTFEQWSSKSDYVGHDQAFGAKVLAKLVETASTRDHWLQLWQMAPADSLLRLVVIEKIKEELKTLTTFNQVQSWLSTSLSFAFAFEREWKELRAVWLDRLVEVATRLWDWKIIRNEALNSRFGNNDLAAQALTKMVDCATRTGTAEDWKCVYREAPVGSHTKQALAYFANQAETFDEWFSVWYGARDRDNGIARFAWREMITRASTFSDWFSILAHDKDDVAANELCLNKLLGLAKTFEDWVSIYQSGDDKTKASALVQVLAKASTLDDWLSVWYSTPDGSEAKAQALEKVRSFVKLD